MSKRPWMPLDIGDYLRDTGHLTVSEHGAYLLLIMHYWINGGLPAEEKMIARISRMTSAQWEESRDVIAALFREGWKHKRIDEEMEKAEEIIGKRRAAANSRHSGSNRSAHAEQVESTSSDTGVPPSPEPLVIEPPPSVKGPGERDLFDDVWAAFPQNPTSTPGQARAEFNRLKAADQAKLLEAAGRYSRWFVEDNAGRKRSLDAGLRFVPHLSTWIETGAWKQADALPIKAEANQPIIPMVKLERDHDHDLWVACEKILGRKAPTDGLEWSFRKEVVDQARALIR